MGQNTYTKMELSKESKITFVLNNVPDVGELDELETFIGSKKTRYGCFYPATPCNGVFGFPFIG